MMEAQMTEMVNNLNSDRADRFDQGCREAAALIDMLQGSLSFPASGGSGQMVETLLGAVGRILEESLKYPNDVARHHALRSVAAALAQALVSNKNKGSNIDGADGAQSMQKQKRSEMEKVINPNSDVLDWDAVALVSRNALLPTTTTTTTTKRFVVPQGISISTNQSLLDSLLQRALQVPSMDPISGAPSALLETAQQIPLPSLNTLNTNQFSRAAWEAYLTLHSQALEKLLSSVLADATTKGKSTEIVTIDSIQAIVDSKPQYKAGIEAIAASPALHIAARKILRAWLATSGNLAIWLLHWHLFKSSTVAVSNNSANSRVVLPLQEYLYPGELEKTAEGVFEACESLEENNSTGGQLIALDGVLNDIRKHSMTDEVFSLVLDAVECTKTALLQLSWAQQPGAGNDVDEMVQVDQGDTSYFNTAVPKQAAEWLSLVMWPFNTSQQRILSDAMMQNSNKNVEVSHQQCIFILKSIWCPALLN